MADEPTTPGEATPTGSAADRSTSGGPADETGAENGADDLSFEDALSRLESIVETLETDPPALDESLDAYEEGVELAQSCLKRLNDAEQRVNELDVYA